ncbi:hypothetical protein GGI42DRAFT_342840 [Trichoderma sp. SZMC 28013]
MSSAADDVVSLFRIHTAALAKQDWATITARLHPNLTRNHIAITAEQYVNQANEGFKAIPDLSVTLDQVFADKSSSLVFGRLIYKDSKVFRIITATDKESIKNQVESLPRTPFDTGYGYGLPEQTTVLKERFTSFIEGITKGNVKESVLKYCAPDVVFNGTQKITREEIIQQNLTIQDALTDLKVEFDGQVVDENHHRVGSAYFVTGRVTKPFKNYLPGQIVQQYTYAIHFINEDGQLGAVTSVVESEKAIDEGNEAAH